MLSFRSREDLWYGVVALAASAFATVVGAVMLFLQLQDGDLDGRVLAWLAMIAAAALCFRRLWQAGAHLRPTSGWAAVLSLSLLLTMLEFTYADVYAPSHVPHNLNISARFDRIEYNAQREGLAVPVTVGLRNTTDLRVSVISSRYSATGIRIRKPTDDKSIRARTRKAVQERVFI